MLSSAAHLAARLGKTAMGSRRAAALGMALATVLSPFTLLIFDALERKNFITLGIMRLSVFPLLSGMLVVFTLVAAVSAIPWRWAATFVCGVIALLAVEGEILYSIAANTHRSTPARVVQVQAGPYPLTVSLYTYPAHASYALPFAIAPRQSIRGTLTYEVSSIPDPSDVPATPVHASLSPDPIRRRDTLSSANTMNWRGANIRALPPHARTGNIRRCVTG